jgi:hypothetical protein
MYYVLLSPGIDRKAVLEQLNRDGIGAVFHYVPLHSSPAGKRYGRPFGALPVTESISERLIRLPMWLGLTTSQQEPRGRGPRKGGSRNAPAPARGAASINAPAEAAVFLVRRHWHLRDLAYSGMPSGPPR